MATRRNSESSVEDIEEDSELVPAKYSITSYGADFAVDGLVARMKRGDVVIPNFGRSDAMPDSSEVSPFQREFVWTKRQSDRFIESLLLGLPVPGIFLFQDAKGVLLVLDGQQRLKTLLQYYEGVLKKKEYALDDVHEQYTGLRYLDLAPEDRRRLDNSIIHSTVIRQDEPDDGLSSVYLIFERLNTGGTALRPQEIRVALFHGPFVELLGQLNDVDSWRRLIGSRPLRSLKDQELILRYLALLYERDSYSRPMKEFLNQFIDENRDISKARAHEMTEVFTLTTRALSEAIGPSSFRPKSAVNAALLDAVMVGVAERIVSKGEISSEKYPRLAKAHKVLLSDRAFKATIERSTADEEQVETRLKMAIAAFKKV